MYTNIIFIINSYKHLKEFYISMALKNITNGSIQLDIDIEDKTAENYKFIRMPGGDLY